MKRIIILVAFALTACVEDEPPPPSYENHVYLECNGSVLVDRTFTSQAACEDYRASNDFYCAGVKLTFSC